MGVPPGRSVTQSVPKKKSQQTRELLPNFGPRGPTRGYPLRQGILSDDSAISGSEIIFCVLKRYCVTHPRNACCVCVCVQGLVAGASLQNQLLKRLCRSAQVFFFQRKQSHCPSGQVTRLEPPESSGSSMALFHPT